jgi:hypothetical protein
MSLRSVPLLRLVRWLAAASLLLSAACASVGDYGASAPSDAPARDAHQELSGQVRNVDHGNRRFLLERDQGGTADIAYDDRTRLTDQGRMLAVAGLEPGDRVRVLASRGERLWRADDIELLRDVRGGEAPNGDAGLGPDERRGAIASIDRRSRTIAYTRGGYTGGEDRVRYDRDTVVEYQGQRYRPDALERGDLVRMRLRRSDQGWVAERIVVEVSARER